MIIVGIYRIILGSTYLAVIYESMAILIGIGFVVTAHRGSEINIFTPGKTSTFRKHPVLWGFFAVVISMFIFAAVLTIISIVVL